MVQKAFRIATSGKPGPVQLDIPEDVLYAEVDEAQVTAGVRRSATEPPIPLPPTRRW